MISRTFDAGGYSFRFESESHSIVKRLEDLFHDLSEAQGPVETITLSTAGGTYGLADDSGSTIHPDGLRAVDEIIRRVNRRSLDADSSRLHLHAAAVECAGHGVIVCADSGTGKTTLTAALIVRGSRYLSDESVALSAETDSISGFNKPLSLKDGETGMVPDVARHHVGLDIGDHHHSHVPASSIAGLVDSLRASLVVMLRRDRDRSRPTAAWRTLRPAEAVVALVESTLDFDRFGDQSLAVLGKLVVSARCVEVVAGTLASTTELVESLATDRHQSAKGSTIILRPVADPAAPWRVTDDTQTLSIGDAAVVRQSSTGVVFELEGTAADLWRLLLASPGSIEQTSTNQSFFAELEALEVITRQPMEAA